MDMIRADQAIAQMTAERVLQRAMSHSMMLSKAFASSHTRRRDTNHWKLLETATSGVLEQDWRRREWYAEANRRLRTSVSFLLRSQASKSGRVGLYRLATDQVYEAAADWSQALDALPVAYWRHSALVWVTLWHSADAPGVTATQAKECLDCAWTEARSENDADKLVSQPTRRRLSLWAAAFWRRSSLSKVGGLR
jgi:hypothetical protein